MAWYIDAPEDVAGAVRGALDDAGMSITELARQAGTTRPNISAYANGRRTPGLLMLLAIARALDATFIINSGAMEG